MRSNIKKNVFKFLCLGSLGISSFVVAENLEVDFLYIGETESQAHLGVQQGIKEANLQGRFLGQSYNLVTSTVSDIENNLSAKSIAILVASDTPDILSLAEKYPDFPIMNLSSDDDELRVRCTHNILSVLPSKLMKQDALQQWRQKNPGSNAVAQTWHPEFKKFAARDLNKRFKKSFNTAMLDEGWVGWAAVKMTSDAVARENITDNKKMLEYLKTQLVFDGQKGINMNFRETGQLRQPVLIVDGDKILAEAPIRGVANPPTIESLGRPVCTK